MGAFSGSRVTIPRKVAPGWACIGKRLLYRRVLTRNIVDKPTLSRMAIFSWVSLIQSYEVIEVIAESIRPLASPRS
jgi:hypothetical protein